MSATVLDAWPIIIEFMGGPRDGECRHYAKDPPFALLFSRGRHVGRYEMDSGHTGPFLRYRYIGVEMASSEMTQ